MNIHRPLLRSFAILACCSVVLAHRSAAASVPLETGWTHPPTDARLRAYWWWLNGNARAPHGPTFFSPPRQEADRLGLGMILNLRSGWHLSSPLATPASD